MTTSKQMTEDVNPKIDAEDVLKVVLIPYRHGVGEGRPRRRDSLRQQRQPTHRLSLGKLPSSLCWTKLTRAEVVTVTEEHLFDIAYLPWRKCRNLLVLNTTRNTTVS